MTASNPCGAVLGQQKGVGPGHVLHVVQRSTSLERRCDRRVSEKVRVDVLADPSVDAARHHDPPSLMPGERPAERPEQYRTARAPVDRGLHRLQALPDQRHRCRLAALAVRDEQQRRALLLPELLDQRVARLADPQRVEDQQGQQCVLHRALPLRIRQQGEELVPVEHRLPGVLVHVTSLHPADRVLVDDPLFVEVPVEPADAGDAPVDRRSRSARLLELPEVEVHVRPLRRQRRNALLGAPVEPVPQVRRVTPPRGRLVASEVSGDERCDVRPCGFRNDERGGRTVLHVSASLVGTGRAPGCSRSAGATCWVRTYVRPWRDNVKSVRFGGAA